MKYKLSSVLPVVLGFSLIGCNNSAPVEKKDETKPVEQEQKVSEPVEYVSPLSDDAPVIKVATEANYMPYEFKDAYGNVAGFDIDLLRAIGEKEGFKVEIHNDPWTEVFTNLEEGTRHMVAAALSNSDERQAKYEVSKSYIPSPSILMYNKQKITINGLENLADVKIGVLSDSSPYRFFTSENIKTGGVETFDTVNLAIEAMVQGKINVVASDGALLKFTARDFPELDVAFFDYEDLTSDGAQTVYVVESGNKELLEKLNHGIDTVLDDGTYAKLTKKWFNEDLTSATREQNKLLQK